MEALPRNLTDLTHDQSGSSDGDPEEDPLVQECSYLGSKRNLYNKGAKEEFERLLRDPDDDSAGGHGHLHEDNKEAIK